MRRTLLVVGASGLLGRHVAAAALDQGWQVVGTYLTTQPSVTGLRSHRLDVTDRSAVERLVAAAEPDAIVHTAYRPGGPHFWAINADGAANVAAAAAARGARLVHLSSDAIFDGRQGPYTEAHDPSPITPYGASKAAAETAVRALAPEAALVRTSLIIDARSNDQHSRMVLDIAAGRRGESLFTDEIRCPVAAADLARAVLELVDLPVHGPFNVAGVDALSRHALGVLVAQRNGIDPARLPAATVQGSGLHRPADVRLDLSQAQALLRTRLRGAREFLKPEEA